MTRFTFQKYRLNEKMIKGIRVDTGRPARALTVVLMNEGGLDGGGAVRSIQSPMG